MGERVLEGFKGIAVRFSRTGDNKLIDPEWNCDDYWPMDRRRKQHVREFVYL